MTRPATTPVGLRLARTAKVVSRAFNDALVEAGGTLPAWLILASLHGGERSTQQELAEALGIEGPTLTRHLDVLEQAGLVTRERHPDDRRAIRVQLTGEGRALHARLREIVIAFDRRLRSGIPPEDLDALARVLDALGKNALASAPRSHA